MYSDTLLDIPIIRKIALETIEKVNKASKEYGDAIKAIVLKPAMNEDFFSIMIERGYPAPHYRFRWCIPRLKIKPVHRFIKENMNDEDYEGIIMITGVRLKESNERTKLMKKRKQTLPIVDLTQNGTIQAAPIIDWTTEEVWRFLLSNSQPWSGESYEKLFEVYRIADAIESIKCTKECALTPTPRFGCWVCTVVRKDKTLINLINNVGDHVFKKLYQLKNEIRKISQTPEYRIKDEKSGKWRGLNEKGKLKIIEIFAQAVVEAPEGVQAYMENPFLCQKAIKWLQTYLNKRSNKIVANALMNLKA